MSLWAKIVHIGKIMKLANWTKKGFKSKRLGFIILSFGLFICKIDEFNPFGEVWWCWRAVCYSCPVALEMVTSEFTFTLLWKYFEAEIFTNVGWQYCLYWHTCRKMWK